MSLARPLLPAEGMAAPRQMHPSTVGPVGAHVSRLSTY